MPHRRDIRWFMIITIIFAAAMVALGFRLHWAASPPPRPKDVPANAIWVPAPPAPLDLHPRGYWLGCWLDQNRDVDRCKLTDYKGRLYSEADYRPVSGPRPVPEEALILKPIKSTLDLFVGEDGDPVARLENEVVLVPSKDLASYRETHKSY